MPPRGDALRSGHGSDAGPTSGVYYGFAGAIAGSSTAFAKGPGPSAIPSAATQARREAILADQFHRKGQSDKAMEHFAAALSLQPDHAEYHFRFACSAWNNGKLALVETHLREAERLDPRQNCVVQALAMWHLHLCQYDV